MKYSCEELVRKMNMKPLKLLRLSVYPLKENIRKNNKIINKGEIDYEYGNKLQSICTYIT